MNDFDLENIDAEHYQIWISQFNRHSEVRIDKRIARIDELYILVKLDDDFNTQNIDFLLDKLSDCTFSLKIGGQDYLKCNIGLLYFIGNYLNHKMFHIEMDKLVTNDFDILSIESNVIKQMIKLGYTGNYLLIPVGINFFLKDIMAWCLEYHEIIARLECVDLSEMVENFSIVEVGDNYRDTHEIIDMDVYMYETVTNTYKFFNETKLSIDIDIFSAVYIMVSIQPDFDKIEKSDREMAISLLPMIQKIQLLMHDPNLIEGKEIELRIENADIRRSRNQHVYLFTTDPDYTLKSWLENHMEKLKEKVSCKDKSIIVSFCKEKLKTMRLELTDYAIPIIVQVRIIMRNVTQYTCGMVGVRYSQYSEHF